MNQQRHFRNSRRFSLQLYVPLLVACLLAVGMNARGNSFQSTVKSQLAASMLTEALQRSFSNTVERVNSFAPNYLTGDFNGDGVQDILIVVRITGRRSELPKDVKVLNPFGYGAKATFPVNPGTNPTLALAIIHGSGQGWQTSPALEKFLLLGESPVLILENHRATSSEAADRKDLMEIIRKRGKRARGAVQAPTTARGDAILLGTEAADSTLYWNGKTYRWQESEGGE